MKFRSRYSIILTDGTQYSEIVTGAIDMAHAERTDEQGKAVTLTLRTIHEALLRQKRPVPPRFDAFLETIDEVIDLDNAEDVASSALGEDELPELPDPTQREALLT